MTQKQIFYSLGIIIRDLFDSDDSILCEKNSELQIKYNLNLNFQNSIQQ